MEHANERVVLLLFLVQRWTRKKWDDEVSRTRGKKWKPQKYSTLCSSMLKTHVLDLSKKSPNLRIWRICKFS